MGIGKAQALARELIDVRRGDFRFGMVARNIAVAQVISQDDNNIGSFRLQGNCESEKSEDCFLCHYYDEKTVFCQCEL